MWKRVLLTVLALSFFIVPVQAADLVRFKTDYDNSLYTTEAIEFVNPEAVPSNWYPLRAVSKYMDFNVDWDNVSRKVIVSYINRYGNVNTIRYSNDVLAKEKNLMVLNNTTYCSPAYLMRMVHDKSFVFDGDIYFFAGEEVKSRLIDESYWTPFRDFANAAMYQLYLKMPDEYEFVRTYLTGGIKKVDQEDEAENKGVIGYTKRNDENGTCYVVNQCSGAQLLCLISHEAYHQYQLKNNMIPAEEQADAHDIEVYNYIVASNKIP